MEQSTNHMSEEALRLLRQGSPGRAAALFQQVLRSDPSSFDAHYYLAAIACQGGDFARGVELARGASALDPRNVKAANLLGRALARIGKRAEALEQFDRAIADAPGFAEAHGNRAALMMEMGALQEALASFDRAVALDPGSISDWQDRGIVLSMLQRHEDAIASYDRVLALRPDAYESHAARAEALIALDRLDEAQAAIGAALRLRPNSREAVLILARIFMQAGHASKALATLDEVANGDAWPPAMVLRGVILGGMGRHDDALACFERCLSTEPANFDALLNGANALCELAHHDAAIALLDRAAAVRPRDATLDFIRGNALAGLGRHDDALAAYDDAIAARPGNARPLGGRGYVLSQLGRHQEALASLDEALAIGPADARDLVNRGMVLTELRRNEEALRDYELAQSISPDYATAHLNEAVLRLLLGDYRAGWEKYEWRWKSAGIEPRDFPVPMWDGEALEEGARLLLHAEQGYGDTIHFARFIPQVLRRGATVIFELQPALKPLYENMPGVTVVGRGEALPRFDRHCPLLSLPLRLGTTVETIPPATPAITAPPERLARWRDRLDGQTRKVGIAWSGNPKLVRDRQRTIAIDRLAPLMELPGLSFVTLNPTTTPEEETRLAALGVVHLAREFADFADTAAVISNLDLVISVDTAVAHLAGAMGKPVWILLPFVPDWRWMLGRDDSPWYPSARLFRQETPGDWAGVVARVKQELGVRPGSKDS